MIQSQGGLIGIPQSRQLLAAKRRPIISSEYETACWVLTGFLEIRIQPAGPDNKWISSRTFRVLRLSDNPSRPLSPAGAHCPLSRTSLAPNPHRREPSASLLGRPRDLLFSLTSVEFSPSFQSMNTLTLFCSYCVLRAPKISSNASPGYEYGTNSKLSAHVTPHRTQNPLSHHSPWPRRAYYAHSTEYSTELAFPIVSMNIPPSRLSDVNQLQISCPRRRVPVGLGGCGRTCVALSKIRASRPFTCFYANWGVQC